MGHRFGENVVVVRLGDLRCALDLVLVGGQCDVCFDWFGFDDDLQ